MVCLSEHPTYMCLICPDSPRKDARTRRERTHIRTQEWQQQIGRLVDGYLAWKAGIIPRIAADAPPPWDVTLVDFWGTPFPLYVLTYLTVH